MFSDNYYRDVPGFEGLYKVNPNGDIITLRNKNGRRNTKLNPDLDQDGYLRVALYTDNGKRIKIGVHKVVAMAFLDNPHNYQMVNHKNYVRNDNRVENLEWCTPAQNAQWSKDHYKGVNHKRVACYSSDGTRREFESISQAARETGVDIGNISNCCAGKRARAGGMNWVTITRMEDGQ